jgi:UDP-glucose 6-dehydrogenase
MLELAGEAVASKRCQALVHIAQEFGTQPQLLQALLKLISINESMLFKNLRKYWRHKGKKGFGIFRFGV